MPKKTTHHQRQCFSAEQMAAGKASSGTLTSREIKTTQSVLQQDEDGSPAEDHHLHRPVQRRKCVTRTNHRKLLKESLTRWLQVFKFPSVERTTYDRLECTAQHQVFPLIGEKIVGDITAADLKSVLNHWMEQGYAYTTVKKVHILLNEYFRYLTEERFHPEEPHAIACL